MVNYWGSLKRFYENLAESEDTGYYLHPVGISRRNEVLRLLAPTRDDKVLDLGCGDGNISKFLVGKVKEIKGLDISAKRVQRAAKKGIDAICGNALKTPYPNAYFDKIICSEVIEHMPQPGKLLDEVKRILKPGGIAVMSIPLQAGEKYPTLLDVPKQDLEELSYGEIKIKYGIRDDHLSFFSEESFISLLKSADFIVRNQRYTYNYEIRSAFCNSLLKLVLIAAKKFGKIGILASMFIPLCYESTQVKHHLIVRAELRKRLDNR